ncbi:MAG: (d)CMP kinase [Actinobacteria bacterium]|nr:(d)CMP kinase [Actinomycetota bacterium]MBU4240567.1 (d)CMP kinase [Actinomycetota bacterium]MBU4301623.1 (d)CMP kinase [Actinomycetota bacterium]MBU4490671.1 (d)CMP kinase [Actinomycetota bacterium]MCG2796813.1 (d)CMP kinase [Actinomycetes bacterium]
MADGAGPVVAIDGPAASGKSTVALALARRLGLLLVDSGSMYRAVAFLAIERKVTVSDEQAVGQIGRRVRADYRAELPEEGQLKVFLGSREVTEQIRSAEATGAVSDVSRITAVRDEMVDLQRSMVSRSGAVVEGRDIGTTVFPDATLKVFLDAAAEERARRRYREFREKGIDATASEVARQIQRRDEIDSSRESSPLMVSAGALLIDTTDKAVSQVVEEIARALEGV